MEIRDSCRRMGYLRIIEAQEVRNLAIENDGWAHGHAKIAFSLSKYTDKTFVGQF